MKVKICNKDYEIQNIKSLSAQNPRYIIIQLRDGSEHCLTLPEDITISAKDYLRRLKASLQMLTYTFGNRGGK